MKPYSIFLIVFTSFFLLSGSCRKKSSLEQLPPETQNGANTFGCLINGEVFKPKGSPFGGPILSCAYQYIEGGFYFHLSAKNTGEVLKGLFINTDSMEIFQNKVYILESFYKKGSASGGFYISNMSSSTEYLTSELQKGELNIKKLDESNRIISGTFWFDAVDNSGNVVKVREGRFDMKYSL